jgi:hypothetical protein
MSRAASNGAVRAEEPRERYECHRLSAWEVFREREQIIYVLARLMEEEVWPSLPSWSPS